MNLIEILESKWALMVQGKEPVIDINELNDLCSPVMLRALRLYIPVPTDYHLAEDVDECIELARKEFCPYRVLEVLIRKNRALKIIGDYIPALGGIYE